LNKLLFKQFLQASANTAIDIDSSKLLLKKLVTNFQTSYSLADLDNAFVTDIGNLVEYSQHFQGKN